MSCFLGFDMWIAVLTSRHDKLEIFFFRWTIFEWVWDTNLAESETYLRSGWTRSRCCCSSLCGMYSHHSKKSTSTWARDTKVSERATSSRSAAVAAVVCQQFCLSLPVLQHRQKQVTGTTTNHKEQHANWAWDTSERGSRSDSPISSRCCCGCLYLLLLLLLTFWHVKCGLNKLCHCVWLNMAKYKWQPATTATQQQPATSAASKAATNHKCLLQMAWCWQIALAKRLSLRLEMLNRRHSRPLHLSKK